MPHTPGADTTQPHRRGAASLPRKANRPAYCIAALLLVAGVASACTEVDDTDPPAAVVDTSALANPTQVSEPTTPPAAAPPSPIPAATQSTSTATGALANLETLPVKGRAPKTGYDRDLFGQAWSDDVNVDGGHNGCDTRNDILRRDLTNIVYKPGSNDCAVQTGTLTDPYTGTLINFVRGTSTSSAVQIDHVVALSDAWQKGAQQLTPEQRANFANDPRNLQAADGPANQQKGDGDAATWLPPSKTYRCTYVSRQVEVKTLYNLWVTQAEKDAIARTLGDCGEAEKSTTAPPPLTTTPPEPVYTPPAPVNDSSVYYPNCAAVRAAGAAPIRTGDPGYSSKLDRDGDGVACE